MKKEEVLSQSNFISHFEKNKNTSFDLERLKQLTEIKLNSERRKMEVINLLSDTESLNNFLSILVKIEKWETLQEDEINLWIKILKFPSIVDQISKIIWKERIRAYRYKTYIPPEEEWRYRNLIHPNDIKEKLNESYWKLLLIRK